MIIRLVLKMAHNVCACAVVGISCASLSTLQKRILKDNTFTLNQNPPLRMHCVGGWPFFTRPLSSPMSNRCTRN